MFKKRAVVFAAVASLLLANAHAIPPEFLTDNGKPVTHLRLCTIDRVDQDKRTITVHWVSHYNYWHHFEETLSITSKTTFSGGSWANLVKGATVRIPAFHFENNR